MAGRGQEVCGAEQRYYCSVWDAAVVLRSRRAAGLQGYGGGLCGVGAAGGGGKEPVAACPEPAAAAEVTAPFRGILLSVWAREGDVPTPSPSFFSPYLSSTRKPSVCLYFSIYEESGRGGAGPAVSFLLPLP